MKLPAEIVRIASAEVGVHEIDGSNCGPRVNEFKAATVLDPTEAWPWCAAFICWVVREALAASGVAETPTFHRPKTASAWGLESWSLAQDQSTWTTKKPWRDILPGDLVIFKFSHCGIATSALPKRMRGGTAVAITSPLTESRAKFSVRTKPV